MSRTDQKHYPEEWGPSGARRLTCACGDPDPMHGERLDFEAWAKRRSYSLVRATDGGYAFAPTRAAWDAWMHKSGATEAREGGPARDQIASLVEGMSVSVDVSTGDHDADHRYFGTVTEAMHAPGDKHGLTLLVQDAKPNFTAAEGGTKA